MYKSDIDAICSAVRRGGKLFVGRDHFGKTKLKLQRGPFGLWVTRFEANDAQVDAIRSKLGKATNADASRVQIPDVFAKKT